MWLSWPGDGLMATKHAATDHAQIGEFVPASGGTNETGQPGVKQAIGPDGRRLTLADLPLPGTKRWVIRRKAEVVAAVRGGLLSLEEACSRYALNPDEFLCWQQSIASESRDSARPGFSSIWKGREAGVLAFPAGAGVRAARPHTS
jgi:hypothetical protein